jgi:hypothetical protein
MTEVFLGHKEDLEIYCEEAEADIKAIEDATSKRAWRVVLSLRSGGDLTLLDVL